MLSSIVIKEKARNPGNTHNKDKSGLFPLSIIHSTGRNPIGESDCLKVHRALFVYMKRPFYDKITLGPRTKGKRGL